MLDLVNNRSHMTIFDLIKVYIINKVGLNGI